MKTIFTILILAVFAAGIGIGSLVGMYLPGSNTFTFETSTTTSRGLSFNEVQLAEPKEEDIVEPLRAKPSQPSLEGLLSVSHLAIGSKKARSK